MSLYEKFENKLWGIRFPYELYQKKRNVLFIHIPKAAGTSILRALGKKSEAGRRHVPWHIYERVDYAYFHKAFKFAFVRHPHDRCYSAYNYLMQGGNQTTDLITQPLLAKYKSFDGFAVEGLGEGSFRNHLLFQPQSNFLCDENGKTVTNFLGKTEDIVEDTKKLSEMLNVELEVSHLNRSSQNKGNSTSEARQVIYELYKQDYKTFNYEP